MTTNSFDAAVPDTADTDTKPLTSEIGHPISEGDTDTEHLTPETGQPISERDTDTNTAKEKRQLTLLESVPTSVSSGTSNTHKQPT